LRQSARKLERPSRHRRSRTNPSRRSASPMARSFARARGLTLCACEFGFRGQPWSSWSALPLDRGAVAASGVPPFDGGRALKFIGVIPQGSPAARPQARSRRPRGRKALSWCKRRKRLGEIRSSPRRGLRLNRPATCVPAVAHATSGRGVGRLRRRSAHGGSLVAEG
jgi:hypothetical protein